jgi:hypothetical protein
MSGSVPAGPIAETALPVETYCFYNERRAFHHNGMEVDIS